MYNILGDDFKFVATEPLHEERLKLGYHDMSESYSFSLNAYSSCENEMEGLRLGNTSDVVIIGAAPDIYIKNRLDENKITFRYSERIFKYGKWRVLNPGMAYSLYRDHTRYRNRKVYMLCASAYAAGDFNLVGAYKKKTYKWGYFPEAKNLDIADLFSKKKNAIPKLLWAGRFIPYKHSEHAVMLAKMLKKQGYDFTLDLIGSGPMENYLRELIKKFNIETCVKILGSMPPESVRENMEKSNIFLFTSNFEEGWGAVLNESMNSGCAVVASHAIGSVPFMLRNGVNGFIYKNGDLNQLLQHVKKLLDDAPLREILGINAFKTILEVWNPKTAAERFILLSESLIKGDTAYFETGPCSSAEIINQKNVY